MGGMIFEWIEVVMVLYLVVLWVHRFLVAAATVASMAVACGRGGGGRKIVISRATDGAKITFFARFR